MRNARATILTVASVLITGGVLVLATSQTRPQTPPPDGGRYSDAEKAYVPAELTKKGPAGLRQATLDVIIGRKFSDVTKGPITISNPYMDPATVFFVRAVGLAASGDDLLVGGEVGLDANSRVLGTGYWRIASDGAVRPVHARSSNTYGKTPATKCEAPYSRTHLNAENFALAPDGRVIKTTDFAVVAVETNGFVRRLAGEPFACEESGQASRVRGNNDGPVNTARFDKATEVLVDPTNTVWVVDQNGCALRRIANGQVTTVITPEQACGKAPMENRPALDHLAWDPVNGEIVSAWSRPVAQPVHNLYTTVWRIKPSGEFRRVLYATKVGKSPAKHLVDGLQSMTVDPQGRVYIASSIMRREGGSVLAVLRVDEAGATVVPVTGAAVTAGAAENRPRDGAAARAQFRYIRDMSFTADGTLYLMDEHLIRKLDRAGNVTTWAF